MKKQYILKITCTDSHACSKTIVSDLETSTGKKLYARHKNDKPDGYVSILHEQNKHQITHETYEK